MYSIAYANSQHSNIASNRSRLCPSCTSCGHNLAQQRALCRSRRPPSLARDVHLLARIENSPAATGTCADTSHEEKLMASTPKFGRTLRLCAALFCAVSFSACPGDDDDDPATDAGSPNGEAGKPAGAGKGGSSGAGTGGHSAAGTGGKQTQAGKGGTGGKIAQAGSGGKQQAGAAGDADADSGVSMGKLCGTRGAGECKSDEFCNFEPDKDCGATDRGGSCEVKPGVCTADYTPVCGCDDKTYGNACSAHSAGVSVKSKGECAGAGSGSGTTCGGIASLECGAKEFCNYESGQGCDGKVADAAGKCETIPSACTREYQPVCSCDRKTHGNKCEAHSAGASVMHDGACTVSDCNAVGGRVAVGIGPAPMCNSDEVEHTSIINDDGSMAIEGMLCCVKK